MPWCTRAMRALLSRGQLTRSATRDVNAESSRRVPQHLEAAVAGVVERRGPAQIIEPIVVDVTDPAGLAREALRALALELDRRRGDDDQRRARRGRGAARDRSAEPHEAGSGGAGLAADQEIFETIAIDVGVRRGVARRDRGA